MDGLGWMDLWEGLSIEHLTVLKSVLPTLPLVANPSNLSLFHSITRLVDNSGKHGIVIQILKYAVSQIAEEIKPIFWQNVTFGGATIEKPKHHHHDHPLRQVTWPMVSDHVCRWLPIKQEADTRQGATILQPIATIAAFSGFAEIETNCNICLNCNHLATNWNQLQPIAQIATN